MKTIICALLSLIFILALLQSLEALTYDFEDAEQEKDWEALRGVWEIKDGEFRETGDADAPLVAVVGEPDWTDYTISVRAKGLVGDADWGIAFRVQDINNHYSWQYVNSGLMFVAYVGGSRSESNLQGQAEILDEWQDFQVVVEGNNFDLYWNGDLISTFKHDALEEGYIGLFGWVNAGTAPPGGGIAFDDFNAEGPGIPTSFAVEAHGKLTTTWGGIRSKY